MEKQRVLVTGGHGFLGTHVCERLRRCPWVEEVLAPRSSEVDLRKEEDVRRMYASYSPDMVFHLAAVVGGIGANKEHPGKFFYDNLLMGLHAMHQAYVQGVKKFVCIGTICAYPKFTPVPFREDDLWNGYPEETNAPYGIAKKALLVQAQAYRGEYGFNAIYLLPVNLYGPGDNFDLETSHVIAGMTRKFVEAKEQHSPTVSLWGDGTPTREFLYIEDAAEGIVLAAEKYNTPEPVNLGTGQEITMKDLANLIAQEVGYTGKIVWDTSKPNGQPRRCLDVRRAKERFGFQAAMPLSEGIRKTVAWFLEHRPAILQT